MLSLSVIIPAYLEEENLRILLPRLIKTLNDVGISNEILIIDTMESMDNTELAVSSLGAIYINRENGNNYGDAVRTGIKKAKGESILFMDADGSHSPETIPELLNHAGNFDIVIASRYIKGGGSDNSKLLIFMSLVVNSIYAFVLGFNVKDISNSFKLYNSNILSGIELKCNNFDIVEEILVKIKRKKKYITIKEIPYLFKERMFGKTKRNLFSFIASYIVTLFRLRFMK
ncbi:MAG: glycosyltransferase [bacterium]|nr:glycosyltransferase [bacterium]